MTKPIRLIQQKLCFFFFNLTVSCRTRKLIPHFWSCCNASNEHGQKLCDILKLWKVYIFHEKWNNFSKKAEWTWNSSFHYNWLFCKAWSFNLFKKVLILRLPRKIRCSAWLPVENTIYKLIKFCWGDNKAECLLLILANKSAQISCV